MYKVFTDGNLLYDPRVEELEIFDKKLSLEVNTAGGFDFTIYPSHPMYNAIKRLKSSIEVYQDNHLLFRGRVLDDEHDFYNAKKVICEGELAFFNDSIIRPFEFQGSITEFLQWIIDKHNEQVGEAQQFILGDVTVSTSTDYVNRSSIEPMSSWEVINTRLLDLIGGFIMVRRENNVNYIDYLQDSEYRSLQEIELGENLLDLKKEIRGQDIITALIPYGARLEDDEGNETDQRLTIEAVNNGKDYVFNQEAVDKYGWIFGTKTWDDVTLANNLLTRANEELAKRMNLQVAIEVNAIDLSMTDTQIDNFRIFEYVKVNSPFHLLEDYMLVSKLKLDLDRPENNKLMLGIDYATFTERQNETEKAIKNVSAVKGPKGEDGQTTYTWVKYADSNTGAGMSDNPEGKKYIGLAFNKTTQSESDNASDYQWSEMPQNIQFGIRNLMRNTSPDLREIVWESWSQFIPNSDDYAAVTTGEMYTASVYLEEITGTASITIRISWFDVDWNFIENSANGTRVNPEESGYIHVTDVAPEGAAYAKIDLLRSANEGVSTAQFKEEMFAKGNMRVDWTLSLEDVLAQIDDKAGLDYVSEVETLLNSSIEHEASAIRSEVERDYTLVSEFEEYRSNQSTQYEQLSDSFNFNFNELQEFITNIDGETKVQFEDIQKYIRFEDGKIVIGVNGDSSRVEIMNNRISFIQSGVEVAYISNQTMEITHGIFVESATISDYKFEKIPDTEILSITWVGS